MSKYIEQTEQYRGYTIEIVQDEDPPDPREWSNLGHMICRKHRNYNLGDEQRSDWGELFESLTVEDIVIRLGLIDHSGISMYIGGGPHWTDSAGWDSGDCGIIYCTKADIIREYGEYNEKNVKTARRVLEGEVETYDQYLTGEVYGWRVEETDESVWGYYGQEGIKDAMQEARSSIDWECKKEQEEYEKQPKKHAAEMYMI